MDKNIFVRKGSLSHISSSRATKLRASKMRVTIDSKYGRICRSVASISKINFLIGKKKDSSNHCYKNI